MTQIDELVKRARFGGTHFYIEIAGALEAQAARIAELEMQVTAADGEIAALDAAAAVDGDAQWNAAIEAAAQKAGVEFCGDDIATAIRSLKRG